MLSTTKAGTTESMARSKVTPERTRLVRERAIALSPRMAEAQKAAWDKRFFLLTNLVRSLREGSLEPGTGPDDSEAQPETDVTS